ncbi:MAG TPA: flavin monoamine oxidase family protein [Vicinamibacterales bacterium]|jgi:monoamine oxidase|nr:flavin monoamine oxidase family protein [Vicinamibacterales bacterium]
MPLTRRAFFERLGATAGAALAYESMVALGVLGAPATYARGFSLQGRGDGVRVAILGAGLAGMATAYELGKLGYACTVLEARTRPGGRCVTVRRGFVSEETRSTQTARFDEGLYFNAGPMRIPHHHHVTLAYLREFKLPIEVFVDDNASAYVYQTKTRSLKGQRLRAHELRADFSGYVAELLAKALTPEALNQPLTPADREAFTDYLRRSGGLDGRNRYQGSPQRGYVEPPGAGDKPGTVGPPIPLRDLLESDVEGYLDVEFLHQPAMFQVVGGTDRLAHAFADRLRDRIVYGAEVRAITQGAEGVSVAFVRDGRPSRVEAHYAVCAMPLSLVSALETLDVSPDVRNAIAGVSYATSGKIGLQFKRRFWEEDDGIYGGISHTDQDIEQVVYPSTGYLGQKGILVGYYQLNGRAHATAMGQRTPTERTQVALGQGELIHPQYRKEFETAFSVAWEHVRWNRGGWAQMAPDSRRTTYPLLSRPDRRLYFAGDHTTYVNAWMQGALESGRAVATAIHARAVQERLPA